jgi:cell division protein FtsI/penicillin-binding protein 2
MDSPLPPLQLAQAYAIFANEGRRVPLTLLKRADDEQPPVERVISKEVAQQVADGSSSCYRK